VAELWQVEEGKGNNFLVSEHLLSFTVPKTIRQYVTSVSMFLLISFFSLFNWHEYSSNKFVVEGFLGRRKHYITSYLK